MNPYYPAADVFVLASTHLAEDFGFVQLEATCCGKPVINTSIPTGVPGVSPDGTAGLTVPPEDPTALAKAINLLLANHDLRMQYGEAGRRRAAARYDLKDVIDPTHDVYEKISAPRARFGSPSYGTQIGSVAAEVSAEGSQ